jgi:hypothetical protein
VNPPAPIDPEAALAYEKFIGAVLELRKEKSAPVPMLLRVLQSAGGVALITIVLGGLFGEWVIKGIQRRAADQQQETDRMRALARVRLDTLEAMLTQVSAVVTAAGGRISALGSPDAKATARAKDFNAARSSWQTAVPLVDFRIRYYFSDGPAAVTAWEKVAKAVNAFADCAADPATACQGCAKESKALGDGLDAFAEAARREVPVQSLGMGTR